MLGPRYVLTTYQKKLFDVDYEKHKKRLDSIQKNRKKINEDSQAEFRSTFSDLRVKHTQFQTTEKVTSIDKDNQVLLDKLVKISRSQKPPLFKVNAWVSHPGTLNTTYRKRELERIAQENEAMARRLISQHASIDQRKFKTDFQKHLEFSKNVQKVVSPTGVNRTSKLPPLSSPKAEGTQKRKLRKGKKAKLEEERQAAMAMTNQTEEFSKPGEEQVDTHPIEKARSQDETHSKEGSQTHTQEEVGDVNVTNQVSHRSQAEEAISNKVKSSEEISSSQKELAESKHESQAKEELKLSTVEEKKGDASNRTLSKEGSERLTKRSGTVSVSNKNNVGESRGQSRRVSNQIPRKESVLKSDGEVPDSKDNKEIKEQKDTKEIKEHKENKEVKDSKEVKEESKDSKDNKEAKDVKDNKESKEIKEQKDTKEVKENKDAKENKEHKETKEHKESKEVKDAKEVKENKEHKEVKDNKEVKDHKDIKENKEHKDNKEAKDVKEAKENKEHKEIKENKEAKDHKDVKENKEHKDTKDPKDSNKENKDKVEAEEPVTKQLEKQEPVSERKDQSKDQSKEGTHREEVKETQKSGEKTSSVNETEKATH